MQLDCLKGYTILLNAHYIPGPLAAWFLRNLGARVIKIEPPGGDLFRHVPPFFTGPGGRISAYFRALNAGFESISVNLKEPEGVAVFEKLLQVSHVYIDGNRPGFLQKLIGKTATEINPELISVPISAFGLSGPCHLQAGHDGNCMAMAGTLSHNGDSERGISSPTGIQAVDITAGLIAACTAMGMLLGRRNPQSTARPAVFDGSMLDAAVLLNQIYVSKFSADANEMQPGREWLNGGRGYYATYQTADGRAVFFGAIEDKLFQNFTEKIERSDLLEIRRQSEQNPSLLLEELKALFASRSLSEWEEALRDCDCCFTPVRSVGEAFAEPQIQHRGMIREINDSAWGNMHQICYPGLFDNKNIDPSKDAPAIGQHTNSILAETGHTPFQIQDLLQRKVVRASV